MDSRFQFSAYRYFLIWGILSSLALTICTLVDATLVGNLVGDTGLAVSNIATPVYLIYALFGITIGVGSNVHISRFLGADDKENANKVFHSALTLGLIISLISLCPLLFERAYFSFLGVTDELYPLAKEYLGVVMWSAPIFIMYHIVSASVRTDSNPRLVAIASAVVIITNIVLDVVFMKFMAMGIKGASLSLCIGEFLGLFVLLTHFARRNKQLGLKLGSLNFKQVRNTVSNGFALGSAQIFSAVVMLSFNTMLLRYGGVKGTFYVAVYGIIYTLSTIPVGVYDGNSASLQTVISFLSGESDTDGIYVVLKRALITVSFISLCIALCFVFLSPSLFSFFGINPSSANSVANTALRVFALSIIFTGINTSVTAFWQSIGRRYLASVMSLVRNCLLLLISGFILIPGKDVMGVATSYVITEVAGVLIIVAISWISPSKAYVKKKFGLVGSSFEKTYPIEKESMGDISKDLEEISEKWELDVKKSFMINFISEEILLNIIKFALENGENTKKEYYISIKLINKDDGLVLRIRDNVSQYNPFEAQGDEIDSGVLKLIKKKTKYSEYQRKMVFNYFYTII